ncbi:MAG TPA: M20/M25/M40 family metallo-hydrolase [Bryobacteraceae bacterium]|nr:M20/M25/M40 family metallo-hydrolase [Bryobacteraceae bacterium]
MRPGILLTVSICIFGSFATAQTPPPENDPIKSLVARLDLAKYKATIRGLTKFGDRRQGTDRNRAAIDWIEAQLKSYGCSNTERIHYDYQPPARGGRGRGAATGDGAAAGDAAAGGASDGAGGGGRGGAGEAGRAGRGGFARAGGRIRGERGPTAANNDPDLQPDSRIRELDSQPSTPGPREEVFCTKIGTTHPEEMYIVGAHMDGIGYGEAANDDGSGTALVMEVARVLSSPDVTTERTVRFALWNNEETGLNGARAYVDQRKDLQGKEDPPGSGRYPEPKWLGMIQHDMLLFDHGMPLKDGAVSDHQRPEADVNIEFQSNSKFATGAAELAWAFLAANEQYATDYPAVVGNHMTNTDSGPFQDLTPSISLRELERVSQIGGGWDPTHHQPTDVFSHFSEGDFRLGLNATQTTLGAIARLAGAKLK